MIPFEVLTDVSGLQGFVYTLSEDSLAKKIPVAIGFLTNRAAAIDRGLEKTCLVVTEGAVYLEEGMPVKVVP